MILTVCLYAFTQDENKMAVSLGAELNMNTREMFAGGLVLSFDYNLPVSVAPFAAGLAVTSSFNFKNTAVVEFAALFRWYFLDKGHDGWFAQAEAGYSLISENRKQKLPLPLPVLAGLRIGNRLPLGSSFYAEPYARFGYSFFFGLGVMGGMRF